MFGLVSGEGNTGGGLGSDLGGAGGLGGMVQSIPESGSEERLSEPDLERVFLFVVIISFMDNESGSS